MSFRVVLGCLVVLAAEYKVSEVADRNAGIVVKLNKELLKNIH